jgi:hypothetical protein
MGSLALLSSLSVNDDGAPHPPRSGDSMAIRRKKDPALLFVGHKNAQGSDCRF